MNLPLDTTTNQNVEHLFHVEMIKNSHLFYFLNVYAEKGQPRFVKSTVDTLTESMYYQIAVKLNLSNEEFHSIRETFEAKVESMVENLTSKFYEKALAVHMQNL